MIFLRLFGCQKVPGLGLGWGWGRVGVGLGSLFGHLTGVKSALDIFQNNFLGMQSNRTHQFEEL